MACWSSHNDLLHTSSYYAKNKETTSRFNASLNAANAAINSQWSNLMNGSFPPTSIEGLKAGCILRILSAKRSHERSWKQLGSSLKQVPAFSRLLDLRWYTREGCCCFRTIWFFMHVNRRSRFQAALSSPIQILSILELTHLAYMVFIDSICYWEVPRAGGAGRRAKPQKDNRGESRARGRKKVAMHFYSGIKFHKRLGDVHAQAGHVRALP